MTGSSSKRFGKVRQWPLQIAQFDYEIPLLVDANRDGYPGMLDDAGNEALEVVAARCAGALALVAPDPDHAILDHRFEDGGPIGFAARRRKTRDDAATEGERCGTGQAVRGRQRFLALQDERDFSLEPAAAGHGLDGHGERGRRCTELELDPVA